MTFSIDQQLTNLERAAQGSFSRTACQKINGCDICVKLSAINRRYRAAWYLDGAQISFSQLRATAEAGRAVGVTPNREFEALIQDDYSVVFFYGDTRITFTPARGATKLHAAALAVALNNSAVSVRVENR